MSYVSPYLKAIAAAIVAGLGALQVAYAPNHHITTLDWINVSIVTIVALGAVWAVPNGTKPSA